MTLALSGKTTRRKWLLVLLALAAVLASMAGASVLRQAEPAEAAPVELFSDSFGAADANPVPAPWTDSDGAGTEAQVLTAVVGGDALPSAAHARLQNNQSVTTTVNTTGFWGLELSFVCRGDPQNEGSDDLQLHLDTGSGFSFFTEWNTNSTSGADCQNDDWVQQTVTLPFAAGDLASLGIRFVADNTTNSDEMIYVDEVVLTGESLLAQETNPGGFDQCTAADIHLLVDLSASIDSTELATLKGGDRWGWHGTDRPGRSGHPRHQLACVLVPDEWHREHDARPREQSIWLGGRPDADQHLD